MFYQKSIPSLSKPRPTPPYEPSFLAIPIICKTTILSSVLLFFFLLQEFIDSFSRALAYEYSSYGVEIQVCYLVLVNNGRSGFVIRT